MNEENKRSLTNYISSQRERGVVDEDIKNALSDAGWSEDDISVGFVHLDADISPPEHQEQKGPQRSTDTEIESSISNSQSFPEDSYGVLDQGPTFSAGGDPRENGSNAVKYIIVAVIAVFVIGVASVAAYFAIMAPSSDEEIGKEDVEEDKTEIMEEEIYDDEEEIEYGEEKERIEDEIEKIDEGVTEDDSVNEEDDVKEDVSHDEARAVEEKEEGVVEEWVCGQNFVDNRDNEVYATVLIGDQCWFAEDLRHDGGCSGNTWTIVSPYNACNDQGGGYDGLLYQWDAAMGGSTEEGAQGQCPTGWHIPTDEEWKILEGNTDPIHEYPDDEWGTVGYRGTDVGDMLKDLEGGWCYSDHCGNSGFNAVPGGWRSSSGSLFRSDPEGRWWTSSEYSSMFAFFRRLKSDDSGSFRNVASKNSGYSVRCLRD